MTIRARLTWWSVGLMAGGLILLAGFAYFEFVHEHPEFFAGAWTEQTKTQFRESLQEVGLFAGLPAVLLGVCGVWWLFFVRRALRPLENLTLAAEQLNVGNLRDPLPRSGNDDEIDRLATVLNAAKRRLDDSFQRVREFTLHASHELKTPLTIMHAALETALQEEGAALTSGQRERIGQQLEEMQRLSKIVDGLTLLTKADAGLITLHREPLRLDELVRETFEDVQILAQPHQISVELTACDESTVSGDRNRLRQLLLNLADNAIKYNHPGGRVTLALRQNGSSAELAITNTGPGLPVGSEGRVFDRFFRGDASHSSEIDGCGLGLSIARCIVQLHGGRIEFNSVPGRETTVRVSLPSVVAPGEFPLTMQASEAGEKLFPPAGRETPPVSRSKKAVTRR